MEATVCNIYLQLRKLFTTRFHLSFHFLLFHTSQNTTCSLRNGFCVQRSSMIGDLMTY